MPDNPYFHGHKERLSKLVGQKIKYAALQRWGYPAVELVTESDEIFVIGHCMADPCLSVSYSPTETYRKTEHFRNRFKGKRAKIRVCQQTG
jgi:hypothetical protein